MKGFIEFTGLVNDLKIKTLINVNQIIGVAELNGKTVISCNDCDEANVVEESYEEIKEKIAEAVGEDTKVFAKWEICCDGYYPYCSNCKNEPKNKEMTDYCPNCGAKMKGR